ncbi:MAG TPA: prepilin-type N-terminal cleavage/methylation domain-containing protein [Acidimicrobiales bacterium]|nr:prepilin-type N-terminal cleavage/methylation domain-containing protein [Acidimicrobiales bacterium]
MHRERDDGHVLTGNGRRPADRDEGFTLIEIMIVCLVMAIVLAIAGNALISLTTTSNRNSAMLGEEQKASIAMTELARDIRSAAGLTFDTGLSPSVEVDLYENPPSSSGFEIRWIYTAATGTLARQQLIGGTWQASGISITGVINTSAQAVFSYYNPTASAIPAGLTAPLPASAQTALEVNATAIGVDLYVSAPISGTPAYHFSDEVTMTNVLNASEPPGEGI